jgi:hypothetical protein
MSFDHAIFVAMNVIELDSLKAEVAELRLLVNDLLAQQ